ncbi:MAG: hypothetical protein HC890_20090 [Chloroflexaceae bacterium]|nr:hypothetical protein [Chloroflexaceae bacterium]
MLESTPKTIRIVTEEAVKIPGPDGARSSDDIGGYLGQEAFGVKAEAIATRHQAVEVETLKTEMRGFLQAMHEILEEAERQPAKLQLDEVELSVEINGEGKISLFGMGGAKIGGKGAMTLKFKRNNG